METIRLLVFTALWTVIWAAPLPKLSRHAELAAGLIPFAAFGLRVFAGFFVGVHPDDRVRMAVGPVVDWVSGASGAVPYQWVLDGTVAIGLAWLASAFDIPRASRLATIWIMPLVVLASSTSLQLTGLPLERLLTARMPAPLVGLVAGAAIGGLIRWTPGPLAAAPRRRAAVAALAILPLATAVGSTLAALGAARAPGEASACESIAALGTGAAAGAAAYGLGGLPAPRSRLLLALSVGVAAGAIVAQAAAGRLA